MKFDVVQFSKTIANNFIAIKIVVLLTFLIKITSLLLYYNKDIIKKFSKGHDLIENTCNLVLLACCQKIYMTLGEIPAGSKFNDNNVTISAFEFI